MAAGFVDVKALNILRQRDVKLNDLAKQIDAAASAASAAAPAVCTLPCTYTRARSALL